MRIGLDIGSTTIKCVALSDSGELLYNTYERHYSHIAPRAAELLDQLAARFPDAGPVMLALSGSAGMGIAEKCGIPFVQEVYATRLAADRLGSQADVIIELGGEDAKILFLTGGVEVRMNGSCAGGTGAFIDQMGTLLGMTPDEMDEAAAHSTRRYDIASRCGVFAKSDIQPLLNQGAQKSDICMSILHAVVSQTIAGLAQGRPIRGRVLYLGGPLTFLPHLRQAFDEQLGLTGLCPPHSLYYVAFGAAFYAPEAQSLSDAAARLRGYSSSADYRGDEPLFASQEEYQRFCERHARAAVPKGALKDARDIWVGIDAGSTTVKAAAVDSEGRLVFSRYQPSGGNPVPLVRAFLQELYAENPDVRVHACTTTGYGEDLVKAAFRADLGIVETVAHFTAARRFLPQVDFVIDIGGQDMKCFKAEDGAISDIFLNEACSSGCGSFLQTFAGALGYSVRDFAQLGLFADRPADLGSRCTVFMNSSVKQAQKDGASIENISAGLSISVVKNALYKVIRASSPDELGRHVVVQGGTFYNHAVLRAFEKEMGCQVVCPDIAGLMGAYGAALYGLERRGQGESTLLSAAELEGFSHEVTGTTCGLCPNRCRLTVNRFDGGRRFLSGNRCERPITHRDVQSGFNLYETKRRLVRETPDVPGAKGRVGIPIGLNMFELYPFWRAFFASLGWQTVPSPVSDRDLYLSGQGTIPSDTVCYPAKLMHGHIEALKKQDVDFIFYPCMSYNLDEHTGDNHYNCPVVAYYPEVIAGAYDGQAPFIYDYIGLHREKDFPKHIVRILRPVMGEIAVRDADRAMKAGFAERQRYLDAVRAEGVQIIEHARSEGKHIIVLSGRPYHIDPEVSHGIDQLICSLGAAVISEDAVSHLEPPQRVSVLNQWTYHARLYAAARRVCRFPDMDLVQLVSFGCGVDAITTDEVRRILREGKKLYTQIKIDEIANLGAVKIRVRSLLAALEERRERHGTVPAV